MSVLQLEAPEWKTISSNAKDLVLKMLAPNIHNRLTIEGVLNHPWMRVSSAFYYIISHQWREREREKLIMLRELHCLR